MAPPSQTHNDNDDDDNDYEGMPQASAGNTAFSILQDKTLAVTKVALCPTMDLCALLTADGSLLVLRTISWQKLHALPAADFQENRVTALAWSPDGNVLALGHERGGISLFDVEKGEPSPQPIGGRSDVHEQSEVLLLSWFTQHRDPSTLSALDLEKERSQEAARYYQGRDEVFLEELPALGQQSGSFAAMRERQEEPVGAKLTAARPSMDVLVACFRSGGVLLLSSGVFPLLTLRVHDLVQRHQLPGSASKVAFASTPNNNNNNTHTHTTPSPMLVSSPAPPLSSNVSPGTPFPPPSASPSADTGGGNINLTPTKRPPRPILRVQAVTATPDLASLVFAVGHGDNAQQGTSLLALHTPWLWANRYQLKPLTAEFSALSSLMSHLQESLDLAERHWKDSLRTLDIKLELFTTLLRDYACPATPREAFLSLILSGVACPALSQYLSQNSSEPQQHNMFRLSKTIDEKCACVCDLLREHIGRVAEMVVYRASKLRGYARTGDDFQSVGLSASAVSALVDAAGQLSLKVEEALREVHEARQNLKVFLLWLLDTMQHPPGGNVGGEGGAPVVPPARAERLTFRQSSKHVRMLLGFLRKPLPFAAAGAAAGGGGVGEEGGGGGGGGKKMSNTEAVIAVQVSAYFQDEPLPLPPRGKDTHTHTHTHTSKQEEEEEENDENDDEYHNLTTISLRTQVKEVRQRFEAVFKRPPEALKAQLTPCRCVRVCNTPLAGPPDLYAPPVGKGEEVVVALVEGHGNRAMVVKVDVGGERWRGKEKEGKGEKSGGRDRGLFSPSSLASSSFFPLKIATIKAPPDRLFQQASLYGHLPLLPSQNPPSLLLLARGAPQSMDGRASVELWKVPLAGLLPKLVHFRSVSSTPTHTHTHAQGSPLLRSGAGAGAGAGAGSGVVLEGLMEEVRQAQIIKTTTTATTAKAVPCLSLGGLEGVSGRQLTAIAPEKLVLTVTGTRGVATVTSRGNYMLLVDMEEDEEEEEEEEEEEGVEMVEADLGGEAEAKEGRTEESEEEEEEEEDEDAKG